jgi:hypothetical protein
MEPDQSNSGGAVAPEERRTPEELGALERIREILFGASQRDLDRRLLRVDNQSSARLLELEQETRRRIEIFEAHLKQETETLTARLQSEVGAVGESMRKLGRQQRDSLSELEDRVGRIEESVARGQRELRQQLLDQAKGFLDELQRMRKDLLASLQEELGLEESERTGSLDEAEVQGRH